MTESTTSSSPVPSPGDKAFSGSIPRLYETYLVPLIFEPYARDLVDRLAQHRAAQVLELAAGTGVVTRAMAARLPADVSIVATDLNQAMLDQAAAVGTSRPVTWQQADALRLPFDAGQFDAVVCQFGAMFFPDKGQAFAEVRRVLRPGGVFLFNVWDRLATNELAAAVTGALGSVFPQDPPRFMDRIPHGYYDPTTIARDLVAGGFTAAPRIETVPARGRAASARIAAVAYCQGTPMRNEIEARDAGRLEAATDAAEEAVARQFGRGPIDSAIQALVVSVAR
jgi:SAM-dependent methyltransferase